YALTPKLKLVDSSGTECIRSYQQYRFPFLFELSRKLSNGSGLPYTINTHDHDNIGLLSRRGVKSVEVCGIVLRQQSGNFIFQQPVKFGGANVFVAGHPGLNTLNDFQRSRYANIR